METIKDKKMRCIIESCKTEAHIKAVENMIKFNRLCTELTELFCKKRQEIINTVKKYPGLNSSFMNKLIDACCVVWGITTTQFQSKSRKLEIVKARQTAMTILLDSGLYTSTQIGYKIGRKDHATVLHAKRVINKMIQVKDILIYPKYIEIVQILED